MLQGSKSHPYSKQCNATNPDNWNITYERRLLREIRTISGGVMLVTGYAIGGELLYDASPTDGSIYKSVFYFNNYCIKLSNHVTLLF